MLEFVFHLLRKIIREEDSVWMLSRKRTHRWVTFNYVLLRVNIVFCKTEVEQRIV